MAKTKRQTSSEIDGVQYNRAKNWQIILSLGSNATSMAFNTLIGLISYLGNSGYGITVAIVGVVLTSCRVFYCIAD